eukprot:gene7950-12417_t
MEQENKPTFFKEFEQVKQILNDLKTSNSETDIKEKTNLFRKILDIYQEQCELLDSHLEYMINFLIEISKSILNESEKQTLRCSIFQCLYSITKVRGYKVCLKFFHHDIEEIEYLFKKYQEINFEEWETRYILLLWLSLIIRNPFPLESIGGNEFIQNLLKITKNGLSEFGKVQEGCSIFLSRLLIRPDMKNELIDFIKWSINQVETTTENFLKIGIFDCLCRIFKFGKRDELIEVIPFVISQAMNEKIKNVSLKKLSVKLTQRIGITLLPNRNIKWRYKKEKKILFSSEQEKVDFDEEDDFDIPESIEEIIEFLLNQLRNSNTIIRWSASKGLGRIVNRLPKDFGDEVVGFVQNLFTPLEGENSWHGGCLTLAELAKRGLLLPNRLDSIIEVIEKALQYDVKVGSHSVGSNVRDAACYVCWAFARSYDTEIMEKYVKQLAYGLMKTAIFDREVNCRRSASAAFQENVGRQGKFPNGIEILQIADYFTLSNRNNSYLEVGPQIAKFDEYSESLIDHLIKTKINHWDKNIRELTSSTLSKLTFVNQKYIEKIFVDELLPNCYHADLQMRHGVILSISEILFSLSKLHSKVLSEKANEISMILPEVESKRLYTGKGGEYIREAVCLLVESISKSHLKLPEAMEVKSRFGKISKRKTTAVYRESIEDSLKNPKENISQLAVRAFKSFCEEYYKEKIDNFPDRYVKMIQNEKNPSIKRGITLAIGSFPRHLMITKLNDIIEVLIEKVKIEKKQAERDAESRRNAVIALIQICETAGSLEIQSKLNDIFNVLIEGTNDYSCDNRGDVGVYVREASIIALEKLLNLSKIDFTTEMKVKLISEIMKQSIQPIEKYRESSIKILKNIFKTTELNIPNEKGIKSILLSDDQDSIFLKLIKCLKFEDFSCSVTEGIVLSIGSPTSHCIEESSFYLLKEWNSIKDSFHKNLKILFENYKENERIIIPLMNMIRFEIENFLIKDENFIDEIQQLLSNEMKTNFGTIFKQLSFLSL